MKYHMPFFHIRIQEEKSFLEGIDVFYKGCLKNFVV